MPHRVTEAMINWKRRLFHHDSPDRRKVRGREVGFTGRAGRVIIDDPHRLAQFEAAREPRQRLEAARAWLLKLAVNGDRAAYVRGDPAIEAAVSKAIDDAAHSVLIAAASMQRELVDLIGDAEQAPHTEVSDPKPPLQALGAPALRLVIPQMRDRRDDHAGNCDYGSQRLEPTPDPGTAPDPAGSA